MLSSSIEECPAVVDGHEELRHWEADTAVSQRQGKEAVVFTIVERITDHYIASKIPGETVSEFSKQCHSCMKNMETELRVCLRSSRLIMDQNLIHSQKLKIKE